MKYDKEWYGKLKKSPLTPPDYVFGIVWPLLYILLLMYVVALVIHSKCEGLCPPLIPFIIQLIINFSWSPVFFRYQKIKIALGMIILMILLTGYTMYLTYPIDARLILLLLPYFLWICFAGYLNLDIVLRNR